MHGRRNGCPVHRLSDSEPEAQDSHGRSTSLFAVLFHVPQSKGSTHYPSRYPSFSGPPKAWHKPAERLQGAITDVRVGPGREHVVRKSAQRIKATESSSRSASDPENRRVFQTIEDG